MNDTDLSQADFHALAHEGSVMTIAIVPRMYCVVYWPASSLRQSLPVTRDAIRIYPLSSVALLCRIRVSETGSSGQLLHQHAAAIEYQETELADLTRWNGRITNASKR